MTDKEKALSWKKALYNTKYLLVFNITEVKFRELVTYELLENRTNFAFSKFLYFII